MAFCSWCEREHDVLAPEDVKAIYSYVTKHGAFPHGVADVRHIEQTIKADIASTAEFHRLVNDYLIKQSGTKFTDGQKMKQRRAKEGLTQSQLGKLLGVTKKAIVHYESGKEGMPKMALDWANREAE